MNISHSAGAGRLLVELELSDVRMGGVEDALILDEEDRERPDRNTAALIKHMTAKGTWKWRKGLLLEITYRNTDLIRETREVLDGLNLSGGSGSRSNTTYDPTKGLW